jgi:SAM-dependent methyltransferase
MKQTPVHDQHNPDLLRIMPENLHRVIEFGCSSGALAREYKKTNAGAHYTGVEIDASYAELARRHCDEVLIQDLDQAGPQFFDGHASADCWVFGDVLEHLKDPWRVLSEIRRVMNRGCVVACIPNAQHWSVQARLCTGAFRYEDSGLMDRTHLRWFTRITMLEMFRECGFKVEAGFPRIFHAPQQEKVVPAVAEFARLLGVDPKSAVEDCLALQYVLRVVPL